MVLCDIGIVASAKTLRGLAAFFISAAQQMEEMGSDYDHIHLIDEWAEWQEGMPDIQVLSE